MEFKADKGLFNGSCNRRDCQLPGATWYNHSTRAYYCYSCAALINQHNQIESQVMFGHDLCTNGEESE